MKSISRIGSVKRASKPGAVFEGRYRIERMIGGGGTSHVYQATQLGIAERSVALKVLRPELTEKPLYQQRFLAEVKTVAKLQHPNTVRLYDFGETADGDLYLVTELLSGTSLQSVLDKNGTLEPSRAVRIAIQALKALAEAHVNGVIHRDVKPDNVFICDIHGEPDFVKLIDFGIASGTAAETEHAGTSGTPHYMSPEQIGGHEIGPWTDIYAVGVLLYEMVTGQLPFDGAKPLKVMMAHVDRDPPSIRATGAPVPEQLATLIESCLAKSPRNRPRGADALIAALDQLLNSPQIDWDSHDQRARFASRSRSALPRGINLRTAATGDFEALSTAEPAASTAPSTARRAWRGFCGTVARNMFAAALVWGILFTTAVMHHASPTWEILDTRPPATITK